METILCLMLAAIMAIFFFRESIFIRMGITGQEPTFMTLLQLMATWTVAMMIAIPFALFCILQRDPQKAFNDISKKFWE